eukprot:gene51057-69475_t
MQVSFTPADIIAIAQPKTTRGATTETVRGLASLTGANAGDLSFLGNPKYKAEVAATRASVVLLPADYLGEPAANQLFIFVDQPSVVLGYGLGALSKPLFAIAPTVGLVVTARLIDRVGKGIRGAPRD